MGQHENPTVSDAPPPAPHQALSSGVHQDAGFSHVGDTTGNAAWSHMTGATKGSPDQALTGGASGAGDSHQGSIDFASHPDIYNQSDARSHSGMPGGAHGIEGRSAGGGSPSMTNPGGDATLAAGGGSPAMASPGADAPLAPGGATPSPAGPGADAPLAPGGATSSPAGPGVDAPYAQGIGSSSSAGPGADAPYAHGIGSSSPAGPGADAPYAHGIGSSSPVGPGADAQLAPGGAGSSSASPGGDAALAGGGATNTAGVGDHRLAAGSPDLSAGGAAGSPDNGLAATDKSKITDGRPSNLEPSAGQSSTGFERLSPQDQMQAPVDKLNATATQNNQNLVSRIGDLGDQLPRVAFHGATAQRAQMIDDHFGSAGGSADGADSSSKIFVASPKTTASDPETRLGDLANAHAKAESYRQPGQPVYAFDMSGTTNSDYWTKNSADTTSSVGGPFASTTQSYEANMPLSSMQPLAQIPGSAADRVQPDPSAPDYQARVQALDVLHRQNAMDAVISAAEQKYN